MHRLHLILLFLLPKISVGQNLVQNGSFEEYSDCPTTYGRINLADGWIKVRGSGDYYNLCGSNGFGVPDNANGNQNPFEGNGYGGLATYALGFVGREYVRTYLIETLQADFKYNVSIKLSLADTSGFAVKSFGFASLNHSHQMTNLFYLIYRPKCLMRTHHF